MGLVVSEFFVGAGFWVVVTVFELTGAAVVVVARVGVADVVVDFLDVVVGTTRVG